MSEYAYRMTNRVQVRLKDILKRKIVETMLDPAYFYLDQEDFVSMFDELKQEIQTPKEVTNT